MPLKVMRKAGLHSMVWFCLFLFGHITTKAELSSAFGKLKLFFIENRKEMEIMESNNHKEQQEGTVEPQKESLWSKLKDWFLTKIFNATYILTDLAHILWHNTVYGTVGTPPSPTKKDPDKQQKNSKTHLEKTMTTQLKSYGFIPEFKEDGQIVIKKEKMIAGEKGAFVQKEEVMILSQNDILNATKLSLPDKSSIELLHAIASVRKALDIYTPIGSDVKSNLDTVYISVTPEKEHLFMSINGEKGMIIEEKEGTDYAQKMEEAKKYVENFISKEDLEKTMTNQFKAYGLVPEFKENGEIVISKEKMIAGEKGVSLQKEEIITLFPKDILDAKKLSLPDKERIELLHAIASTRKALNIKTPVTADVKCRRGMMHISVAPRKDSLLMSINGERRMSFRERKDMDLAKKMADVKKNIADFRRAPRVLTINEQHFKFKGNEIKINNGKFISVKDERDVQRVLHEIKDLPLFENNSPQAVAYTLSCLTNPALKAYIHDGQAYNAMKDSLEPQGASHVFTRDDKIIYMAPTENGGKTETTLTGPLSAFEITKEDFFKLAERVDAAKDAMEMNQFIASEYDREKNDSSLETESHESTSPFDHHMSEEELAALEKEGKVQMEIDEENEKNAEACVAAGNLHEQTYAENEPEL